MIHLLERNTRRTYIYRLYPQYGTLRYVFAMPVSYRGHGEWEAHAWLSVYKLWPKDVRRPPGLPQILLWIHDELEFLQKRSWLYIKVSNFLEKFFKITYMTYFSKLTGVFEVDRIKPYQRIFGKEFEFKELMNVHKVYNGKDLVAKYIEFKPK